MLKVSEIYIYPIKSMGGISLQESQVEERGLQYDRRWLLVDENNQFLTIRQNSEMTLIDVSIEKNGLLVKHKTKNFEALFIPFLTPNIVENAHSEIVKVWDDEVSVISVSKEVDEWFKRVLSINCRLFFQPDTSSRLIDPMYATDNQQVSLADGYPILIAGESSMDDLNDRLIKNKRLVKPISIQRFRPNIVFSGGKPFEEDNWSDLSIGTTELLGVKNCARCPVPNIDPETAERGKEPIRTLASYRARNNKVYFGQNLLVKKTGLIKIGDEIKI